VLQLVVVVVWLHSLDNNNNNMMMMTVYNIKKMGCNGMDENESIGGAGQEIQVTFL